MPLHVGNPLYDNASWAGSGFHFLRTSLRNSGGNVASGSRKDENGGIANLVNSKSGLKNSG